MKYITLFIHSDCDHATVANWEKLCKLEPSTLPVAIWQTSLASHGRGLPGSVHVRRTHKWVIPDGYEGEFVDRLILAYVEQENLLLLEWDFIAVVGADCEMLMPVEEYYAAVPNNVAVAVLSPETWQMMRLSRRWIVEALSSGTKPLAWWRRISGTERIPGGTLGINRPLGVE